MIDESVLVSESVIFIANIYRLLEYQLFCISVHLYIQHTD